MGILNSLGLGRRGQSAAVMRPIDLGIVSPWAPASSLVPIVVADILGALPPGSIPPDRAAAMSIPAVAKARNLLVSHIAKTPLVALDADGPLANQPTFLYRTNGIVSPYERMAWTVDSLIFYGVALWAVERSTTGGILDAFWIPQKDWSISDGKILVEGVEVGEDDVILFNPPHEGLLNTAGRTLRGAIDTENAWVGRMRNPIPLVELSVTDDSNLDQDEVTAYVAAWANARTSPNGAVGFTPQGIELRVHGDVSADLYTEGRNAIRTDVGSFLNVRASMLDGTSSVDSLTYVTKDGERNAFYESDLPYWTDPIAHTLSQDNVVPRGQRVRFDFADQITPTPPATGPIEKD